MQLKKLLLAALRTFVTNIRLGIGKLRHGSNLRFSAATCLRLSDFISMSSSASIDFGKSLRTRGGCVFNAQGSGQLTFGNGVFLNRGCQINCRCQISIGDGCEFGPNVLVFDHDHSYRGGVFKDGGFLLDSVEIGKNCWIGAGSIILRGTAIGAGSVVAAGSVLKGTYPPGSLVLQKRATEISSLG